MKTLVEYICEALNPKINKWFNAVYKSMEKLIKGKKVNQLTVDSNLVGHPDKSFPFKDFADSSNIRKIVSDKQIGFPVTHLIISNEKKFLIDNDSDKELNPDIMPFFYRPNIDEKNKNKNNEKDSETYFVASVIFDSKMTYIDNFAHIINVESSLCVGNGDELLKALFKEFALHVINKIGKFDGLTAKPAHPKIKATLSKIGFTTFKDNKDLMTYKI